MVVAPMNRRLFLGAGAACFVGAAVATIVGLPIPEVILGISVAAIIYAVLGGLRAVVWTDTVQAFLFLGVGTYVLLFVLTDIETFGSMFALARTVGSTSR